MRTYVGSADATEEALEAAQLAGVQLDLQLVAGLPDLAVRHTQPFGESARVVAVDPPALSGGLHLFLDLLQIHAGMVSDGGPHGEGCLAGC